MIRCATLLTAAAYLFFGTATPAQDKADAGVSLKGSVDDLTLQDKAPKSGVVVSAAGWKTLQEVWGIKDAPKLDFGKTILVVATTRGSQLKLTPRVTNGDLKVLAISTRDLRPGFRYAIESVSRDGVKSVNGQPLPKE
ncbi:hypothetical protein [Urbifossiella limnaea]|uniref:Uncharacterized protein n=1 Tax=Urbifossiella limnaea TaxID=2528023 RepID=A0A517XTN6_9BACT|nr:hypothetical protein [Urbifossiella limnaea]QDU20871.1 hypothetical protein ETAA1_28340 [Urbifossiella limnaea]